MSLSVCVSLAPMWKYSYFIAFIGNAFKYIKISLYKKKILGNIYQYVCGTF